VPSVLSPSLLLIIKSRKRRMNLQQLSETISCNHINFLNKKYDLHNSYLFTNQMKCNDLQHNNDDRTFLKSMYVAKKSCVFKPPENDNNNTYTVDYLNTVSAFPVMFNENTRLKTSL
jgi:hypothetical protein